jgi:molybdate transport system ATP-binding protein
MNGELFACFVKRFGKVLGVEANLRCPTNRCFITVLYGPSGCGKTTTLRCLAGLERPQAGRITFAETIWFDADTQVHLPPQQRHIGYLFQEYALFPHLTVGQNIAYGLRGLPRPQRRRRVAEMLELFQLVPLANRYPNQISGGEQQRVALARVLACRPCLLLLDEPLCALDQTTREHLRYELRHLLTQFGIPAVLVTHDLCEAMTLADQWIVLEGGRIRQQGTTEEIVRRPVTVEVARLVGIENIYAGRLVHVQGKQVTVDVQGQLLIAPAPDPVAEQVYVCIRAHEVTLVKEAPHTNNRCNQLTGIITDLSPKGPFICVNVDCGFMLHALLSRTACNQLRLTTGDTILALVEASGVHLIPQC